MIRIFKDGFYKGFGVNLWIIYWQHFSDTKNGFVRLWGNGVGFAYKPKNQRLLFSERNGYTKSIIIGNYRFKRLEKSKY